MSGLTTGNGYGSGHELADRASDQQEGTNCPFKLPSTMWISTCSLATVPKKLVRRGRVCGYRPTRTQLEEMLELAQRGIDDPSAEAKISYWQGDQQVSPQGKIRKVLPTHLNEIIDLAGPNARELSNLDFEIRQDGQIERAVTIRMGPDDQWTTYEVRSDDQTWAFGRYHELTDRLLADRNLSTKAHSARPEVPQRGGGSSWKPGTWEVVDDLRVRLVKWGWWSSLWLLPIVAALFVLLVLSYYNPGGKTHADLIEHQHAITMIRWASNNAFALFGIVISYLFGLVPRYYWLASLRKSIVVLKRATGLSQFSFTANSQNSVAIAGFYVTLAALVVSIIAIGLS